VTRDASPKTTIIHTTSGSCYVVELRDDRWWLCAANVPNPTSGRLPGDTVWEIKPPTPWPPVFGQRLWLVSRYFEEPTHPLRIPGGGKHTSPVVSVTQIEAAAVGDRE
jgi:hypothetical protein